MRRINLQKAQAAGSSTVRGINRQIVLNYVRERQPISRADIARSTALQRSTVSTIVEHLKGEGLIEEIGAGESTGGRRPTLLRLRAAGAIAIGVDVGATMTTVVASDLAGHIRERRDFPTDADVERTTENIVLAVNKLAKQEGKAAITGVGISLPGLVDPSTGSAHYIPYFQWHDWKIAARIARATHLKVSVDNDANAAALAELWFGRTSSEANTARDFIMVLVSEGVGTGIVFDGQVYRGERGAAGEFGHMIVGTGAPVPCSCGNRDCWEAFASGRAAVARYLSRTRKPDKAKMRSVSSKSSNAHSQMSKPRLKH
jgi:predicted NBD/HSP70 family sugar kinase